MKLVIDANCWRLYIDEKLGATNGVGHILFEPTDADAILLFDDGLQIRQQYVALKAPFSEELFDIWFEERTLTGQVAFVELKKRANLLAELLKLGVPKGEHVYFRVAVHGMATYLISLDVDFYDPRQKLAGQTKKLTIVKAGKGPVCKHMKKTHSIEICCPDSFAASSQL